MESTAQLRIGVALPQTGLLPGSAARISRFAAHAESLGFDSLWVQEDTVSSKGTVDPLSMLAIAAAPTVRVQLGVAVLILPTHRAVHLAKTSASLDHLSAGRLILGVGVGGEALPYETFGVDRRNRGQNVERAIGELRRWWASGEITPSPVRVDGPPVWIGGHSIAAIDRAARLSDGFIGGGAASTSVFADQVRRLADALAAHGRSTDEFPVAKRVYLAIGGRNSRPRVREWLTWYYGSAELARSVALEGDAASCVEGLADIVRAGARHLVLNFVDDEEGQLETAAAAILARRDELAAEAT